MEANFTTENYNIFVIEPNGKQFYFPYILCVPKDLKENTTLYVETNNEEDPKKLYISAKRTIENCLNLMNGSVHKSPIFVPILPTNGIDSKPYFQQLSVECFDENLKVEQQRIDLQLVHAIEDAKHKIFELTGVRLDQKIFMHGYSASGVFAQRFALSHPEMIGGVCIGGAIGSIPMPIDEFNGINLDYPIGIHNYEEIFGRAFDFDSYKRIKFRYYVAEKEADRLSQTRFTENGSPAPMHDMSYMERSMPSQVGQSLRNAFGSTMAVRCSNQLKIYQELGIDISAHTPYKGIMHNEIKNIAYKYIDDCMCECLNDREME